MTPETTENKIADNIVEGFPRELLNKSNEERLKYFQDYAVAHPVLVETFNKLWRAVKDPKPGSLVLVYGPAGVGKTTLLEYLEKRIREELSQQLADDREMIPLVKVEARCPENGNFNWKTLYRSILRNLAEPAIDQKLDMSKWLGMWDYYRQTANNKTTPTDKLREVVEQALKRRRPRSVLIDEAQHITILASGRKLNDQQNTVKSIANLTRTTHILFGNYDLLLLRNLNGQVVRRSVDLHFRRYDHTSSSDVKAFKNVLWQFQNHLPLEETPELVSNWQFLYTRSAGCIGVVKETINRALSHALDEECKALEMRHLESAALSLAQASKLLDEALDGEDKLMDEEEQAQTLENRLWVQDDPRILIKIVKKNGEVIPASPKPKPRSVAVRNQKRDAVGAGRKFA
jgi:GTPase SAR1 family protein